MRLDYIKDWDINYSGSEPVSITIEMEYLPDCSKNRYKLRDGTIKRQVREWMDCLSFVIRSLKNSVSMKFKPPVKVQIDGVFKDKRSMPDLHNLLIPINDAIEDALKINDQQYHIETGIPQVGEDVKIIITVSNWR